MTRHLIDLPGGDVLLFWGGAERGRMVTIRADHGDAGVTVPIFAAVRMAAAILAAYCEAPQAAELAEAPKPPGPDVLISADLWSAVVHALSEAADNAAYYAADPDVPGSWRDIGKECARLLRRAALEVRR